MWKRWLLPAILVALVMIGSWWLWRAGLLHLLWDKRGLTSLLREDGFKGPLFCVGAQFVQVVIFFIPGEITQFVAGYVFGAWRGFLYSAVGILLGSAFNFYFARVVGRRTLERIISAATLAKVDKLLNDAKGKSAMFLLFLIPGTPKDAMCYGAGFSSMNLWEFVVITGLARSPALLSSILLGSQASRRDYRAMVVTGAVVLVAVVAYYLFESYLGRRRRMPATSSKMRSGRTE